MMFRFVSAVLLSGLLLGAVGSAEAAKKRPYQSVAQDDGYTIHRHRGGYSYDYYDSLNTYGSHQRKHVYPAWEWTRGQTISGPFDNSFFFDSGIGLHGGDSPYMH